MRPPAMALLVAALVAGAAPSPALGDSLHAMFAEANAAYFKGDFPTAASGYEALIAAGVRDSDVFYNQGVTHARLAELGRAILAFERAAMLAPGDEHVERALSQARQALGKRLADRHGEATVRTRPPIREALVRPFSESLLSWLLLLFNAGTFVSLIARRFAKAETPRLGLAAAAAVLGLLTLLAGGALAVKRDFGQEGSAALVVAGGTHLYEGPDANAKRRGAVAEGSLARLMETEGQWSRIGVRGGAEGWVESARVATLNPD